MNEYERKEMEGAKREASVYDQVIDDWDNEEVLMEELQDCFLEKLKELKLVEFFRMSQSDVGLYIWIMMRDCLYERNERLYDEAKR